MLSSPRSSLTRHVCRQPIPRSTSWKEPERFVSKHAAWAGDKSFGGSNSRARSWFLNSVTPGRPNGVRSGRSCADRFGRYCPDACGLRFDSRCSSWATSPQPCDVRYGSSPFSSRGAPIWRSNPASLGMPRACGASQTSRSRASHGRYLSAGSVWALSKTSFRRSAVGRAVPHGPLVGAPADQDFSSSASRWELRHAVRIS